MQRFTGLRAWHMILYCKEKTKKKNAKKNENL